MSTVMIRAICGLVICLVALDASSLHAQSSSHSALATFLDECDIVDAPVPANALIYFAPLAERPLAKRTPGQFKYDFKTPDMRYPANAENGEAKFSGAKWGSRVWLVLDPGSYDVKALSERLWLGVAVPKGASKKYYGQITKHSSLIQSLAVGEASSLQNDYNALVKLNGATYKTASDADDDPNLVFVADEVVNTQNIATVKSFWGGVMGYAYSSLFAQFEASPKSMRRLDYEYLFLPVRPQRESQNRSAVSKIVLADTGTAYGFLLNKEGKCLAMTAIELEP